MTLGLRLAGFEIRDMVAWVYGSGFPKSLDVSKALDKMAGAEREVVGANPNHRSESGVNYEGVYAGGNTGSATITAPATDAAKQWDGWGTALKPALEPITLARKPLEGTVAANVLKWHTGALNIDGCRVGTDGGTKASNFGEVSGSMYGGGKGKPKNNIETLNAGRWPANLIHDGSEEVLAGFPDRKTTWVSPKHANNREGDFLGELKHPGQQGFNDSGSAARFFFQAKHGKEDLLLCGAKTTIEAWQDQNPALSNVDIVENPLPLRGALESIAQKVAATWPNLAGILSSDSTNPSTSVTASEFETLCATVTTVMTSIGSGFSQESQQEKRTPCNNLVKCVATQEQTGITTITASLLRSDGFAESATLNITLLNTGLGEVASRFRYCAKTSKTDRNEGCEHLPLHQEGLQLPRGKCPECGTWKNAGEERCNCGGEWEMTSNPPPKANNNHPTVKPTDLMRYLCRLVTPPGGVILDPYMGSGSTGKAAIAEDFNFIGIERDESYFKIAEARIAAAREAALAQLAQEVDAL
jgi:hypothetical protein